MSVMECGGLGREDDRVRSATKRAHVADVMSSAAMTPRSTSRRTFAGRMPNASTSIARSSVVIWWHNATLALGSCAACAGTAIAEGPMRS